MTTSNIDKFLASILALNELSRNNPAFAKKPEAQALLNKIDGHVASLEKMVTPVPKVRVLVMPDPSDRNTFVLEAMADTFGLRIVEAEVPAVERVVETFRPFNPPEVEKKTAEIDFETQEQPWVAHTPKPVEPTEGTHVLIDGQWYPKAKGFKEVRIGDEIVTISKETGKPKRPYVRSGKFTAEKREELKKNPRRRLRRS